MQTSHYQDAVAAEVIAKLQAENRHLREALGARDQNLSQADKSLHIVSREDPTYVSIDLLKVFGARVFATGISYDPYICFPGFKVSVRQRLLAIVK